MLPDIQFIVSQVADQHSCNGAPASWHVLAVLDQVMVSAAYLQVQLGERLGEGAFGTTYKGYWRGALVSNPQQATSSCNISGGFKGLRFSVVVDLAAPARPKQQQHELLNIYHHKPAAHNICLVVGHVQQLAAADNVALLHTCSSICFVTAFICCSWLLPRHEVKNCCCAGWPPVMQVAVKCVAVHSETELINFLREAECLAAVRHPNVVPFLGAMVQVGRCQQQPLTAPSLCTSTALTW